MSERHRSLIRTFRLRQIDLGTLMTDLQKAPYNLDPGVIADTIYEIGDEVRNGKQEWKDGMWHPLSYRKYIETPVFPDSFWIQSYIITKACEKQKARNIPFSDFRGHNELVTQSFNILNRRLIARNLEIGTQLKQFNNKLDQVAEFQESHNHEIVIRLGRTNQLLTISLLIYTITMTIFTLVHLDKYF